MMTVVEQLADFYRKSTYPSEGTIYENIRWSVCDCVGNMIAGANQAVPRLVKHYLAEYAGAGREPTLTDRELSVDAGSRAMLYAVQAHVLDFDEICPAVHGHPGVVILPAVIAAAQKEHAAGRLCLEAYAAGMDTACALAELMFRHGYKKGWDSSAVIGCFGATAALADLYGLSRDKTVHALAIAVSEAAGLRGNYGTTAKDLTAGRAAQKAVYAVEMAAGGAQAAADLLESGRGLFPLVLTETGADWRQICLELLAERRESVFDGNGFISKLYPVCRGTHAAVDAVLEFVRERSVSPQQVLSVECLAQGSALENDISGIPSNMTQAKFCMRYVVAVALLYGEISIAAFAEDAKLDEKALELMEKIVVRKRDDLFEDAKEACETHIFLKDGAHFVRHIDFARGDPHNKLSAEEKYGKFLHNTNYFHSGCDGEKAFDLVWSLDRFADVNTWVLKLNEALSEETAL